VQGIRAKAKANAEKNIYPVNTSRGGYKLLEQKLIEQDHARMTQEAIEKGLDEIPGRDQVPAIDRTRTWLAAHTKRDGTYYSDGCETIAKKIVSFNQLLFVFFCIYFFSNYDV